MMRRNLFVLMLFVILFVNCNKVNSMEKKKEIKTRITKNPETQ